MSGPAGHSRRSAEGPPAPGAGDREAAHVQAQADMRYGPRRFTPEQLAAIRDAVAARRPLAVPAVPLDGSREPEAAAGLRVRSAAQAIAAVDAGSAEALLLAARAALQAGSLAVLLREFHAAFAHPDDTPESRLAVREVLHAEEHAELMEALAARDRDAIARELADVVFVAYGTALAHGIDLDIAVEEVHRANMSKLGPDGKPIQRADGKVLKGPGFKPPDMAAALATGPATGPGPVALPAGAQFSALHSRFLDLRDTLDRIAHAEEHTDADELRAIAADALKQAEAES